ncbi:DUF1090 domain-containing protein [Ralstonia insidiosa]|uniref:DUF1090 domain-containing protein n=1 Tax=Ralstonia insidiosa TaxID=190721 RepID=A0A848P2D1_9RALS|nr:DUF1090 domain-containing protein [Ralstonia insidiosa]NMV39363.1 DUF1090 domain-containing protein [Ralstonia insidiosa]
MKKTLLVALTPFALLGAPAAFADTTNCATKIRAIETQIEMAKQYGNTFRIAGLQDALASTKANCTNAGQADHAERKVREAERDVQKAQLEVTEAEDKLKESRSKGEVKRIAKAQKRLAEKQDKLREKQEDLRSAQADLTALKG